jgi:hypothetical protein
MIYLDTVQVPPPNRSLIVLPWPPTGDQLAVAELLELDRGRFRRVAALLLAARLQGHPEAVHEGYPDAFLHGTLQALVEFLATLGILQKRKLLAP